MRVLTKYGFALLSAFALGPSLFAQTLTVDPSYTPQQLIEDVLIGQGVQVSNVQFSGNNTARGYFDGSNSNIGLSSGIIISTGKAIDAEGPNGTPFSDEGTAFNGPGDAELTAISGSSFGTFDAAILEFDFVPSSDTIQFQYVFASNEYMLYVGAQGINDLFAFFISGPGFSGEENVALIPGTSLPVTMTNVNANENAQFYIDNENPPGSTVEYNGFTTVFTAQAIVQSCETYHIRLAIADAGDYVFDSAVFLEAGSFTSPSISIQAEPSFSASSTENALVEGCSEMTLTFERSAPYDDPLSVGLNFSGSAIVGMDVSSIPNTVNFAAGQAIVNITFQAEDDGNPEPVEDMTITLDQLNPCASGPPTSVSFTIEDKEDLTLQMSPDVTFTCPEEYTITATPVGGYANYTYSWSGLQETSSSITVNPTTTTTYGVTVTDACGTTANGNTTVDLDYEEMQVAVADAVVCDGEEATLVANVTGGRGELSYLWDGGGTDSIYSILPNGSATVTLEVTDECNVTETATANVAVDEANGSFTADLVAHNVYQFENTTENTDEVFWEFGDNSTSTSEMPRHTYVEPGVYEVIMTVTNENGCVDTVIQEVEAYPPMHVYVPNSFTPNDDGLNDYFGIVGEGYLYYDLEIFNKWGQKLFSGRFRDDTAWNGYFKGKKVPADAYAYRVFVQPPIGIEFKESGVLFVLPDR